MPPPVSALTAEAAAGTSGSVGSSSGSTSPVGAQDAPAVCTSRSVAKEAVVGFQGKPSESPWMRKQKSNLILIENIWITPC